jgi:hypothetical protein
MRGKFPLAEGARKSSTGIELRFGVDDPGAAQSFFPEEHAVPGPPQYILITAIL